MDINNLKRTLQTELESISGMPIDVLTRKCSQNCVSAALFRSPSIGLEEHPSHLKILKRIIDSTPLPVLQSWGLDSVFWFAVYHFAPEVVFHVAGLRHTGYVVVTEGMRRGWYSCSLLTDRAELIMTIGIKDFALGLGIDRVVERGDESENVYRQKAYSAGIEKLRRLKEGTLNLKTDDEIATREYYALNKICMTI